MTDPLRRLNAVRALGAPLPLGTRIVRTLLVLLLGAGMGALAKALDCTPSNALPFLLQRLDLRNVFSRLGVWALLGLCLSVYARSPRRAAVNVFAFFAGITAAYYLYSALIAGFFPARYAMIWFGLTLLSPIPAVLCWYAAGRGRLALALSTLIVAALFDMTFSFGWLYLGAVSPLEALVFIAALIVLRRKPSETLVMTLCGCALAFLLAPHLPFRL